MGRWTFEAPVMGYCLNLLRELVVKSLTLQLDQLQDRLFRLTDAYIDRVIEKALFEDRKAKLLFEKKALEEKLAAVRQDSSLVPQRITELIELAGSACTSYKLASPEQKRDLLKILTSNRIVEQKKLIIELSLPFREVASRFETSNGAPKRDTARTWNALIARLLEPSNLIPAV